MGGTRPLGEKTGAEFYHHVQNLRAGRRPDAGKGMAYNRIVRETGYAQRGCWE
jgi:hypothetical protein